MVTNAFACRVRWVGTFARGSRQTMCNALMRTYIALGRHTSPQNCPFTWQIPTPSNTWFLGPTSQPPKWHLDQFSSFCTAYSYATHTHTPHATSVAIGRTYALHAGEADK